MKALILLFIVSQAWGGLYHKAYKNPAWERQETKQMACFISAKKNCKFMFVNV